MNGRILPIQSGRILPVRTGSILPLWNRRIALPVIDPVVMQEVVEIGSAQSPSFPLDQPVGFQFREVVADASGGGADFPGDCLLGWEAGTVLACELAEPGVGQLGPVADLLAAQQPVRDQTADEAPVGVDPPLHHGLSADREAVGHRRHAAAPRPRTRPTASALVQMVAEISFIEHLEGITRATTMLTTCILDGYPFVGLAARVGGFVQAFLAENP